MSDVVVPRPKPAAESANPADAPASASPLASEAGTPSPMAAQDAAAAAAAAAATTLARGAGRVSALTMLSRVLGLVREQIFALTLGAGSYSDAFLAAFRIPNLLRDLFAEGALSTAFVPTYVRTLKTEGRVAAFALGNRVLTTLTVYLGTLAGLAMLFPGPVVHLVASGFSAEKAQMTEGLVRIMMPFLPTISVAVVAMGALNAEERYTAPALASSMFNLAAILGGTVIWVIHPSSQTAVYAWAGLTLVGGLAQLVVQVPPLWRLGFRPRFAPDVRLRDPGTRRIAALMAPATLGVAAVQINVVVSTAFASAGAAGSISWLSYAFRLMQLPIGVFGVAVSTTSLTQLSRDAAAGDREALVATLRRGMQMVLFLTVPSTVGLAILGEPIVRLIFEHGRFSAHATVETARALIGYTVGLVAYSAIKVVASAFYALGRTRVPLAASLSAVAANLLWNVCTFRALGHFGLALGTSIAAIVNLVVLLVALHLQVGRIVNGAFLWVMLRIVLAASAMASLLWPLKWGAHIWLSPGWMTNVVAVVVPVGVGVVTYFGAAKLLKIPEATTLLRRFR